MNFLLNPDVRPYWGPGHDEELVRVYEGVWNRKSILRYFYEHWYRRIARALVPGRIVEIASGTGNFSRWLGDRRVVATDIVRGSHIAVMLDAHHLPFAPNSVRNFVMIDALHHLTDPLRCFEEANRALAPDGRFVMLESYMSPWGYALFKRFHHEKPDHSVDADGHLKKAPTLWQGNPAASSLLFRHPERLPLRVETIDYLEFLSYPLSGGFSYRSLLPARVLRVMHRIEQSPLIANRYLGIRMLVVMTKRGTS
jgi:SAM-dependent methyltransferase